MAPPLPTAIGEVVAATVNGKTVEALVGYAADERGRGVAYVRLSAPTEEHLLRVPFSVRRGRDPAGTGHVVHLADR